MIYYRDIENMSVEQILLDNPAFEFRNPRLQFIIYLYERTLLVYEANITGNFDLWLMEVLEDGSFGEPIQLTNTPEDENSLYCSRMEQNLCWIVNGTLHVANLAYNGNNYFLDNLNIIDSGVIHNPICNYGFIAYCKIIENSSKIFYSTKNYNPPSWNDPIMLDITGNNVNLCFLDDFGYTFGNTIFWEKNASLYHNYNSEISKLIIPSFEEAEVFDPSAVFYAIPVDYNPPGFISFTSDEGNNQDVYIYWMEEWAGMDVVNISQDDLMNSNPKLIYGWSENDPCYVYLLDIWETHYSEGVSLNMSKTSLYVCGGVDEMQTDLSLQLNVLPIPFTGQLSIDYYQTEDSPAKLDFYSIHGNAVDQIVIENPEHGWNATQWMPGNKMPKGVYTIVLSQGSKKRAVKTIYQ
jgi:hypothetical protein